MADIEEIKDKATEIFSAAKEHASELAEKAVEAGTPVAKKTLEVTKEKLSELEAQGDAAIAALEKQSKSHAEAALSAVEQHSKAQKKSHAGRKALGWSVAAVGAGGIAYLLWRRSRPVEDPWAEEYWVDLKDEVLAEDDISVEEALLDEAIVEAIEEAIAEAEAEAEAEAVVEEAEAEEAPKAE